MSAVRLHEVEGGRSTVMYHCDAWRVPSDGGEPIRIQAKDEVRMHPKTITPSEEALS